MSGNPKLVSPRLLLSIVATALTATPALGQDAATQDIHQNHHHDDEGDILVTGVRKKVEDVLGGVSVLDGATLAAEARPSIGETLARQPGVSATSFGPAASRPILRGLGGDRIRLMTDGIGSLDLSSSSADHAVAINPLIADRIEILRGPAALLFGSSAIGGVVNVIDRRIPRQEPEVPLHADAMAGYGSAAEERSASMAVDVPLGAGFVLHGDASWSESDDLETGGHLLSSALRQQAAASANPEIRELAALRGTLPNTASRSRELAGGAAYVHGGLNAGFAITRHTATYGVPIRYALEPGVETEAPTIDVAQTRYDGRVEVPLGGFLESVKLRGGYARYRHHELEEGGEIGTSFFTRGGEARAVAIQRERGGWGGASGLQYVEKSVRIRGEEKYLPDARQKQIGLFTLQSVKAGPWRFEAGGRFEHSRAIARADDLLGTPAASRTFATWSASLGGLLTLAPGWKAGMNLSRSARAPAIDELYAGGPHAGTQAFEYGDAQLDAERSIGIEASLRRSGGPLSFSLTAFHSRFSDFIYLSPTGETEDDLPVYRYRQGRARYYGFEAELSTAPVRAGGIDWTLSGGADMVRATIRDHGPAPQIPPLRLMGEIGGRAGSWDGHLSIEHALRQSRTAPNESPTPAYTLVGASIEWHPLEARPGLTLGLSAENLFDVVARRHASILKDYAPLAGRDIRLTARFTY